MSHRPARLDAPESAWTRQEAFLIHELMNNDCVKW